MTLAGWRPQGLVGVHKKTPAGVNPRGLEIGAWQFPTFAQVSALSSALSGFTSEVGMGSGGARLLWPPGKLVSEPEVFSLMVARPELFTGQRTRRRQCLAPHRLGVIWSSRTGH